MFNPSRKEAATASLEYEGGEDREVLPERKKQIMVVVLMVVLRAVIFLCVCVRLMRVVPNIYGFAALQLFGFADGPSHHDVYFPGTCSSPPFSDVRSCHYYSNSYCSCRRDDYHHHHHHHHHHRFLWVYFGWSTSSGSSSSSSSMVVVIVIACRRRSSSSSHSNSSNSSSSSTTTAWFVDSRVFPVAHDLGCGLESSFSALQGSW